MATKMDNKHFIHQQNGNKHVQLIAVNQQLTHLEMEHNKHSLIPFLPTFHIEKLVIFSSPVSLTALVRPGRGPRPGGSAPHPASGRGSATRWQRCDHSDPGPKA